MGKGRMTGLAITGYVNKWNGAAGETLDFYVSTDAPNYTVNLTRLIHGDPHPNGPGIKEETIASPINGDYPGSYQHIHTGSCMEVAALPVPSTFSLHLWIKPTLARAGAAQCPVRLGAPDGTSLSVELAGDPLVPTLVLEQGGTRTAMPCDAMPLTAGQWYALTLEGENGTFRLTLTPYAFHPAYPQPVSCTVSADGAVDGFSSLTLGASSVTRVDNMKIVTHAFNGRIANPALLDRIATGEALAAAQRDLLAGTAPQGCRAQWDFVAEAGTPQVPDTSGNGHHGTTVNRPTRLVTGPNFTGGDEVPFHAPSRFNACHFHEDDLADAGWSKSFSYTVPKDLPSGFYAMKLDCADGEDFIPFFVTPAPGKATEGVRVAVLAPTVSYQVYANARLDPSILPAEVVPLRNPDPPGDAADYVDSYGLRSCYDHHSDGSGVALVSMQRPMPITARPRSKSTFNNSPHQLGADLYLVDWLEETGIAYDVITDHDVHRHGVSVMAPYNLVLSGTHAEYWTADMLDALEAYTHGGGRFMYLSGNGLYWVTALSDDGTVAEIRRDQGTRSWDAAPGDAYISLSGMRGGLWRHRGRAPQKYVGVGFASQGFDLGRPFTRTDASYSSRAAVFFDGIEEETIGDFPALVSAYGAAGYEFDRVDYAQGTPAHALILATASGFSDCYQYVVEDAPAMAPFYGGSTHPDVRADMVFFETPNGGAVFSTSSIAWCSTLSYNGYDNNVSRLMENVVRIFMADGPLDLKEPD